MTSYQIVESVCFIISILCLYTLRKTIFKWFPLFLALTVFVEIYGPMYTRVHHKSNVWIYNIFTPIEIIFYSWLFYNIYQNSVLKKVALFFIPVYLVAVIINQAFIQGFAVFHSYTMLLGDFFMVVFSCLYFYELLRSETQQHLLKIPSFWIVIGLFFFYLGNIFYDLYWDYLMQHHLDNKRKIFDLINNNLIIVLYSCFSIGFLCTRKVQ
jgi:hypothetical protein